jgi:hypothetical protein
MQNASTFHCSKKVFIQVCTFSSSPKALFPMSNKILSHCIAPKYLDCISFFVCDETSPKKQIESFIPKATEYLAFSLAVN